MNVKSPLSLLVIDFPHLTNRRNNVSINENSKTKQTIEREREREHIKRQRLADKVRESTDFPARSQYCPEIL